MRSGRNRGLGGLAALLLAAVTLAACDAADDGDLPAVGEELSAIEQARCEAGGGTWGRGGADGDGGYICFRRTTDANKSCSVGTDCQGFCLARSRSCAPITPMFGCQEVLNDFGARSTVCID